VALESVGNWYWIVDEIEAAGCLPLMAHAAKAKVMMGNVNKTEKLDAKGLATLLHLGSLPTVWLPPHEIRDERELHRTRMALSKQRTALMNRVHSTLAKYALSLDSCSASGASPVAGMGSCSQPRSSSLRGVKPRRSTSWMSSPVPGNRVETPSALTASLTPASQRSRVHRQQPPSTDATRHNTSVQTCSRDRPMRPVDIYDPEITTCSSSTTLSPGVGQCQESFHSTWQG